MDVHESMKYFSADLIKLVCSILGLGYFVNLIRLDAGEAYEKGAHWIPGNAFILSALTIQTLSYLDMAMTVSISDKPDIREMAMLLGNHLLIDSGRLIICVFMGYLLPGMARPGSGDDWGDIFALGISLFTDIASELFYLHKSKSLFQDIIKNHTSKLDYGYVYEAAEQFTNKPSIRTWFFVSSVGMFVSVILLILFLGCTIVAGRTIRGVLAQRISMALSDNLGGTPLEDEVFKSWIVARVCRPEYVIARSVLSSAAGMVVTLRIVLSLVKLYILQNNDIALYYDGLDGLRQFTFSLQCLFVFIGWIVICWRWITAVIYFPRINNTRRFFSVEDFWTRRIMELKFSWESKIAIYKEEMSWTNVSAGINLCTLTLAKMLVPRFLKALQILVVLLSKVCWFLSEIFVGKEFVLGCLLRNSKLQCYTSNETESHDYAEFLKYLAVLNKVRMPEESARSLWVANQKSIKQIKERMIEGYSKGKIAQQLIALISNCGPSQSPKFESLPLVRAYFPTLDKMCWKMTAVSYVKIMVTFFPSSDRVRAAIDAFDQAGEFMNFLDSAEIDAANEMNFLDSLGMEADQMGKAADKEFRVLKKTMKKSNKDNMPTVEPPHPQIDKLMQSAEVVLRENGLLDEGQVAELQDSKDLSKIAPSYSLYRVCKLLQPESNGNDLMDKIEHDLGNVFSYCILQVRCKLVDNCREWAREFNEGKIWEAVFMAGKVKGVLEEWSPAHTNFDEGGV